MFISAAEAKHRMEAQGFYPVQFPTVKQLVANRLHSMISLVEQIHPDFSFQQAAAWVNDHAIQLELNSGATLHDVMRVRSFAPRFIKEVRINPDCLALLGTQSALVAKVDAVNDAPRQSVRALARAQGIDPDYAVKLAADMAERVANYLPRSKFITAEHSAAVNDMNMLAARYGVPTPRGNYPRLPRLAMRRDRLCTLMTDKLFFTPTTTPEGAPDMLLTPFAATLMDFPHIAKAHVVQGHDYGSLTAEDMIEELSKPAKPYVERAGGAVGRYKDPQRWAESYAAYQPPASFAERAKAAKLTSREK